MYGIRLRLKTTITGDLQDEIIGAAFVFGKIVLMSSLAICGVEEREGWCWRRLGSLFSSRVCVCVCVAVGG